MSQGPSKHILDQRFQIEREIGRGGMGIVYHATDLITHQSVAIKVLNNLNSADQLARFQREATLLQRVENKHVVQLLFAQFHSQVPYLVFEFVAGKTLEQRLNSLQESNSQIERLQQKQVLRWLEEIVEAVAACHAADIVHRDLKPSNIMIRDSDQSVVLLDLGVAKAQNKTPDFSTLESLTQAEQILGSLHYMAPEQLDRSLGELGTHTDIWALGALIYYALTLELPFESSNPVAYQAARLLQPARRISQTAPVSPAFDQLISQCLSRDISQRPSISELKSQLSQCIESGLFVRKRLSFLAIFTVVVLFAAVVSGSYYWGYHTDCHSQIQSFRSELEQIEKQLDNEDTKTTIQTIDRDLKNAQFPAIFLDLNERKDQLLNKLNLLAFEYGLRHDDKRLTTDTRNFLRKIKFKRSQNRRKFQFLMSLETLVQAKKLDRLTLRKIDKAPDRQKDKTFVTRILIQHLNRFEQWRDCYRRIQTVKVKRDRFRKTELTCLIKLKEINAIANFLEERPKHIIQHPELLSIALEQLKMTLSDRRAERVQLWTQIVRTHGSPYQVSQVSRQVEAAILKLLRAARSQDFKSIYQVVNNYLRCLIALNAVFPEQSYGDFCSLVGLHSSYKIDDSSVRPLLLECYELAMRLCSRRPATYVLGSIMLSNFVNRISRKRFLELAKLTFKGLFPVFRKRFGFQSFEQFVQMLIVWKACSLIDIPKIELSNRDLNEFAAVNAQRLFAYYLTQRFLDNSLSHLPQYQGLNQQELKGVVIQNIRQALRPTRIDRPFIHYQKYAQFLGQQTDKDSKTTKLLVFFQSIKSNKVSAGPILESIFFVLLRVLSSDSIDKFIEDWPTFRLELTQSPTITSFVDQLVLFIRSWKADEFEQAERILKSHFQEHSKKMRKSDTYYRSLLKAMQNKDSYNTPQRQTTLFKYIQTLLQNYR